MKKNRISLITIAAALAGILIFGACSSGTASSGGSLSITIPLSYLQPNRANGAKALSAETTAVRLWLESQGTYVPLGDGTDYLEKSISASDNGITLDGIAPSTAYKLYVSIDAGISEDFFPGRYAVSDEFSVSAGGNTSVALTARTAPFVRLGYAMNPPLARKALGLNGLFYFIDGNKLYSVRPDGSGLLDLGTVPRTPQGLSFGRVFSSTSRTLGAPQLWIDTAAGVYPYSSVIESSPIPGSETISALDSSVTRFTVTSGSNAGTEDVIVYRAAMDYGVSAYGDAQWEHLPSLTQGNSSVESFMTSLNINTDSIVSDLQLLFDSSGSLSRVYAVIPAFSTVVMDKQAVMDLFDNVSSIDESWIRENVLSSDIQIRPAGSSIVKSIAATTARIYVGASDGLYGALVDSSGKVIGTLEKITLPKNQAIRKVRVTEINGSAWAAALGADGSLYVVKDTAFMAEYRVAAGMPESDSTTYGGDVQWTDAGLLVTGSHGLALLPTGQL
jgi:hypothetical protein